VNWRITIPALPDILRKTIKILRQDTRCCPSAKIGAKHPHNISQERYRMSTIALYFYLYRWHYRHPPYVHVGYVHALIGWRNSLPVLWLLRLSLMFDFGRGHWNIILIISSELCLGSTTESQLLYDWRFTVNHFVLATSPLRLTTSNFFPTEHLRLQSLCTRESKKLSALLFFQFIYTKVGV
jgi:hypothetical protein